jgi:hypothetical protein
MNRHFAPHERIQVVPGKLVSDDQKGVSVLECLSSEVMFRSIHEREAGSYNEMGEEMGEETNGIEKVAASLQFLTGFNRGGRCKHESRC